MDGSCHVLLKIYTWDKSWFILEMKKDEDEGGSLLV
jgi:hypothetical protein